MVFVMAVRSVVESLFALLCVLRPLLQGNERAEVILAAQHAGKFLEGPKEC